MLMPAWMEVVLIQLRDGWTEPAGWADSGYPLLHQHNRSLNTSITIILILGGHQPVMAVGHHLCLASVSSATTYCRISRMPTNRTPRTGTHGDSCCWARCCPIRLTWSVCKMPITTRTGGGLSSPTEVYMYIYIYLSPHRSWICGVYYHHHLIIIIIIIIIIIMCILCIVGYDTRGNSRGLYCRI